MGFFSKLAGIAVSSALGGGGKKGKRSRQQIKPFTPANLYTPSGNATWSGGNGTATLSPELQKYQNYYGENANNYQNQINSYFAPNMSPEQTMYDKLRALSQPAEDQARSDMESRLFSQGLMGASNGQGYNPTIKAYTISSLTC